MREAFERNFLERDEIGAALCVRIGGRLAVDLWGGHCDRSRRVAWRRDTLVNAYSVGKGVLAALVLTLVEGGRLDLEAPVSRVWPEFAHAGKGAVDLRCLLGHRAGLPAVRDRLPGDAMLDWGRMCESLARQAPWWEPGRRHGYHINTLGYLVGEVVRRGTGRSIGAALRRHLTGPLGVDYHWGVPRRDHSRIAPIHAAGAGPTLDGPARWALAFPPTGDAERDRMIWHGYFNPAGISGLGWVNRPEWRSAAIPSTNGHGTADAVCAIYDAVLRARVRGRPLVGPGLRAEATAAVSDGEDAVLRRPSRFGLGFQLPAPGRPLGSGDAPFGHFGYGGSLGFADPEADLAFGYVMNRPGERWRVPRTEALVDAVYASLGAA